MEQCVGCGAKSMRHPIVGIATKGDVEGDRIGESDTHAAHPVCDRCWRVPSSRKVQGLKMHFCMRGQEVAFVEMAGADSLGG